MCYCTGKLIDPQFVCTWKIGRAGILLDIEYEDKRRRMELYFNHLPYKFVFRAIDCILKR